MKIRLINRSKVYHWNKSKWVNKETTITNTDTGQEYESEEAMQADIDDPNTSTTAEKIKRDVKVFAPSLKDMLGKTPKS